MFEAKALSPFKETHEITVGPLNSEITRCQFGLICVQLNVDLVEILKLLRVSVWLKRNVVICDCRANSDFRCKLSV